MTTKKEESTLKKWKKYLPKIGPAEKEWKKYLPKIGPAESGTAVAEKAVEKGYIDKPDKLKKKELVKKNLNKDTISNLSEFYLGKKKDYPKIGKDY